MKQSKVGVNTIFIKEIPIPPKTIMVTLEKQIGDITSRNELFFEPEGFLDFFKPLVEYYEGVQREQSNKSIGN